MRGVDILTLSDLSKGLNGTAAIYAGPVTRLLYELEIPKWTYFLPAHVDSVQESI